MRLTTKALVTAAALLVASNAWAIKDPETGVNFSNTSKCGGASATAAGVGVREATFGIDVYAVVVYVSDSMKGKSITNTSGCAKFMLKFVRDVGAGKIKDAWAKSLKRHGVSPSDANVQKFLKVITGEMKKHKYMIFEVNGSDIFHSFMGRTVRVTGAAKLARAIKATYLKSGSPTPTLVKDVRKRGVAKP
ncbi:MAG: chalcone isomerase family protein [Myxococcales bacterium]|nr:chalcone isomerase family protein [Myxococcales bacterium]